jgi:hypothetical protein
MHNSTGSITSAERFEIRLMVLAASKTKYQALFSQQHMLFHFQKVTDLNTFVGKIQPLPIIILLIHPPGTARGM